MHRNEIFEWPPSGRNVEATPQTINFDHKAISFERLNISYKQTESIGPLGVVKLDTTDPRQQLAAFGSRIDSFERRNRLMLITLRAQEQAEARAADRAAAAAASPSNQTIAPPLATCANQQLYDRNMSAKALIMCPIFDPVIESLYRA